MILKLCYPQKNIRRPKHHKYFLTFYFLQYDSSQFTGFVDGYLENLLSNMIRCSDQNLKNSKSYVWYRDAIIIHTCAIISLSIWALNSRSKFLFFARKFMSKCFEITSANFIYTKRKKFDNFVKLS